MFFTITGVNCAGKSSLCKKFLQDNPNYLTHHFENPKDEQDGKNQYYTFLDNYDENKDYILDRFHEGEFIYAKFIRNYTASYLDEIEERFYKMNSIPFYIYVYADLKDIKARAERRGEDLVKPEQFLIERQLFDKFMHNQHLSYCEINTSILNHKQAYNTMKNSINKWKQICDLTKDWKVKPRGDINAQRLRIVSNKDTLILRPDIKNGNLWITEDKCVQEQINIIQPDEVIYDA